MIHKNGWVFVSQETMVGLLCIFSKFFNADDAELWAHWKGRVRSYPSTISAVVDMSSGCDLMEKTTSGWIFCSGRDSDYSPERDLIPTSSGFVGSQTASSAANSLDRIGTHLEHAYHDDSDENGVLHIKYVYSVCMYIYIYKYIYISIYIHIYISIYI